MRARLLLMLAVPALAAAAPTQALEISGFRSGLVCRTPTAQAPGRGWICHPTQDIAITDHGRCNYAGENHPCTWYGFEFDYRGAVAGDSLECEVRTSRPTELGNPEGVIAKDTTLAKFTIELEAGGSHFFNPQYFVYRVADADEAVLVLDGRCSHAGRQVFEFVYRLRFPQRPGRDGG